MGDQVRDGRRHSGQGSVRHDEIGDAVGRAAFVKELDDVLSRADKDRRHFHDLLSRNAAPATLEGDAVCRSWRMVCDHDGGGVLSSSASNWSPAAWRIRSSCCAAAGADRLLGSSVTTPFAVDTLQAHDVGLARRDREQPRACRGDVDGWVRALNRFGEAVDSFHGVVPAAMGDRRQPEQRLQQAQ